MKALVSKPYRASDHHKFDWRKLMDEHGVSREKFSGAGVFRIFPPKLLSDYTSMDIYDDVVKLLIRRAMKSQNQNQKSGK
ncbi:MAG: hypothetical protein LBD94_03565 [Rickettsiales bacterium]|jgi:hypothetical protein|nr:hypothetical protein [Rickettsiales bacterium]